MARAQADTMFTVKVDNLPFSLGTQQVKDLFQKFGEIGDVYIPRARDSRESRGFAFVRFMQERDAEDAMAEMEGFEYEGRQLHLEVARQRRQAGGGGPRDNDRSDRNDRYDRNERSDRRRDRSRGRHDDYDDRRRSDRYERSDRDRSDRHRRSSRSRSRSRSRRHERRSASPRRH